MKRTNPNHHVQETRDWAKMILSAGLAVSFVVLAVRGEVAGAAFMGAMGSALAWIRR